MVLKWDWRKSKGIWGGLLAATAGLANMAFGIDVGADLQSRIVETVVSAGAVFGGVGSIIGRFHAALMIAMQAAPIVVEVLGKVDAKADQAD